MHLVTYVLQPSSHWGYGPASDTDTGTHCDPRRSHRSKNNLTLGTSSACWSMQAWRDLVGHLGYQPDVGSVCWGSIPNIDADDYCGSCRHCLFFVAVCLAGNPAVFDVPPTVGVVGGILPFPVVVLESWLGRA